MSIFQYFFADTRTHTDTNTLVTPAAHAHGATTVHTGVGVLIPSAH